jgi:sialate O-acetylesterase
VVAADDGTFEVTLDTVGAGGPYTLTATCSGESVAIGDLWAGDIWVAGGQSNMELTMDWIRATVPWEFRDAQRAWAEPTHTAKTTDPAEPAAPTDSTGTISAELTTSSGDQGLVRQFFVPAYFDFTGPRDDFSTQGLGDLPLPRHALRWATTAELGTFSAAAYFFARRIAAETGVVQGIVATAVGGTPARAWTAPDTLVPWPDEVERLETIAQPGYVEDTTASDLAAVAAYDKALDAADLGLQEHWYDPGLDDSSWETHTLDDDWGEAELGEQSGAVWWRVAIDVPEDCAGPATLCFGQFVDADRVWVNGRFIGGSTYRFLNREYDITLPAGRVVITVRVLVYTGEGQVTPGMFRVLHTPRRDWDLSGLTWRARRGATTGDVPATTTFIYEPAGLYNAMIAPLAKLSPTGVLWYQGESDAVQANTYCARFSAVVDSWRRLWGEVPFLWVELAHWAPAPTKQDVWAELRRAQRKCLSIPATAMVAAEGLGDSNDLHPRHKRDVGERLAWAGLEVVYGRDLGFSPYMLRGAPPNSDEQ